MILIIDNNSNTTEKYLSEFRYLGVSAFGISEKEFAELVASYNFDAFLIVDSSSLNSPVGICKDLKCEHRKTPLIVLAGNESESLLDEINTYADNIILPNTSVKKAIPIIMEYIRLYSGRSRTDMIYRSVRVELYSQTVFFFGERFHTSKSEYLLIRYLVNSANVVSLDEIKKFCFNYSPDISNHAIIEIISRINTKAEKSFGKRLIAPEGNGKYTIAV